MCIRIPGNAQNTDAQVIPQTSKSESLEKSEARHWDSYESSSGDSNVDSDLRTIDLGDL